MPVQFEGLTGDGSPCPTRDSDQMAIDDEFDSGGD